jgi:hypothetical protein
MDKWINNNIFLNKWLRCLRIKIKRSVPLYTSLKHDPRLYLNIAPPLILPYIYLA